MIIKMNKNEYLTLLSNALHGIPDSAKVITFCSEMIDDRIEEGMSEAEAVESMENVGVIRDRIISETPLPVILKEKTSRKVTAIEIVLLILGFPLWFPLLMVFAVMLLTFYILIGTLMAAAFIILISFALAGIAGVVFSLFQFAISFPAALFSLGAGLTLISMSILFFYPALFICKGLFYLTKMSVKGIKTFFIGRKKVQYES